LFKKFSTANLLNSANSLVFFRKIYKAYHGDHDVFREGNVLQRLGRVLSVTPSQNVVVKLENTPKMGAAVIDENLRVIGRIFDIIGPVSAPYAVVRPSVKDSEKLANKQLYVSPSKKTRS
jgi:RNA-binding protein